MAVLGDGGLEMTARRTRHAARPGRARHRGRPAGREPRPDRAEAGAGRAAARPAPPWARPTSPLCARAFGGSGRDRLDRRRPERELRAALRATASASSPAASGQGPMPERSEQPRAAGPRPAARLLPRARHVHHPRRPRSLEPLDGVDPRPLRFQRRGRHVRLLLRHGLGAGLRARSSTVHGWLLGTPRIAHRVWQVYWAHIGSFLVVAGADGRRRPGARRRPLRRRNSRCSPSSTLPQAASRRPAHAHLRAELLRHPAHVPRHPGDGAGRDGAGAHPAGARRGGGARPAGACANAGLLSFTADHETGRDWFFNPFAWQLTSSPASPSCAAGCPRRRVDRRLIIAAVAVVLLAAPVGCQPGFACYAGFGDGAGAGRRSMTAWAG